MTYDEKGERQVDKKQLKYASPKDKIIVGKVTLEYPIVIENYENSNVMGQFIAEADSEYIGRGKVLKHVPFKSQ